MSMIRKGTMTGDALVSQAGNALSVSAEGVAQIVARVKTDTANLLNAIGDYPPGTAHPTFTTLLAREYTAITLAGGISELEIIYRGYISPLPDAVWTVETTTGEENIRTNPNWDALETLAKGETPSGYVEDENGAFVEFTAPAELAGVESFLAPKTIVTRRYVTTTFPAADSKKVGQIDTPPSTGANGWSEIPNMTETGENWLKISFNSEDLGDKAAYLIQEQWMKSGPAGFGTNIYALPS